MNPNSAYPAAMTTETFTPDRLLLGGHVISRKITIDTGVLVRGTVIGKITSGGKYIKSLSAAADGSQTPDAILAEDVDATSADVEAMAYFTGDFDALAITLGTAHTVASVTEGLRVKGIHLITPAVAAT
jgi:hypothetical protein